MTWKLSLKCGVRNRHAFFSSDCYKCMNRLIVMEVCPLPQASQVLLNLLNGVLMIAVMETLLGMVVFSWAFCGSSIGS